MFGEHRKYASTKDISQMKESFVFTLFAMANNVPIDMIRHKTTRSGEKLFHFRTHAINKVLQSNSTVTLLQD